MLPDNIVDYINILIGRISYINTVDSYELWKVIFTVAIPFVGALIGAFVAVPFTEWKKDEIAAKRQSTNQRQEIIERLRIVTAYLNSFAELMDRCNGWASKTFPNNIEVYWKAMTQFNLDHLELVSQQLNATTSEMSENTVSGQLLVEQVVIIVSLMKVAKEQTSDRDLKSVLEQIEYRFKAYNHLVETYVTKDYNLPSLIVGPAIQKARLYSTMSSVFDKKPSESAEDFLMYLFQFIQDRKFMDYKFRSGLGIDLADLNHNYEAEALLAVINATVAALPRRGLNRNKFVQLLTEYSKTVPNSGPAAIQHSILLNESKKLLRIKETTSL